MAETADAQLDRLANIYQGRFLFGIKPVLRYGIPRCLLYFDGGVGDNLLCATVLHELRKRGHHRLWMMTNYPELFFHNDDVDAVVPMDWRYLGLTKRLGGKVCFPIYAPINRAIDRDTPPPRHIVSYMCQLAGVEGPVTLRPYFIVTDAERAQGQIAPRQVIIQSSGLAAQYPMINKEWFAERFQKVVDALKGKYTFLQVGSPQDPLLDGAVDLRGKTSVRQLAALLSQSLVFVGLVGFIMHLARAVECRSVIVYGGRESPSQTGYCANDNLFVKLECSPCWQWNRCDFDRNCMRLISADEVIESVDKLASRFGEDLPEETDYIPSLARG